MEQSEHYPVEENQQQPAQNAVMDVVAPPPTPTADKPLTQQQPPASGHEQINQHQNQHPQTMPKNAASADNTTGNGVGFAIFATVVIVLGLAALATYAYIKTAK